MKIETEAADGRKHGFTLAEVEYFCAQARRAGASGTERVDGTVTFGGRQYRLSVKLEEGDSRGELHHT